MMEIDTIAVGDCLDVMGGMPDGCVQTVVTSPPYWGLRDYGNPPRIWGGEAGCGHEWRPQEGMPAGYRSGDTNPGPLQHGGNINRDQMARGQFCQLCGAWRGCLGLEPTPELYVSHLVEIFREVKRVLREDGTVWLNLGDTYSSGGRKSQCDPSGNTGQATLGEGMRRPPNAPGLKPKDLIGIPWRVAFALQADGWWLRSDIIWEKPNAMPASVRDRPTTSHEHLFLLAKSRRYFYDQDAIREPVRAQSVARGESRRRLVERTGRGALHSKQRANLENGDGRDHAYAGLTDGRSGSGINPAGRNRRTVWTIPTGAYSGAHFAVFPEALVEPCIKAGTSERGACPECGAGWVRVVEKQTRFEGGSGAAGRTAEEVNASGKWAGRQYGTNIKLGPVVEVTTIGWRPSCTCGLPDGFKPDDLELILTPIGERVGDDPSLTTGRAGYNRPRDPDGGTRPITRYEQRQYARRLRDSPHRAEMEEEAGPAFAHYSRTDKSGGRPVPQKLLDTWIDRGRLEPISMPEWAPSEPVPSLVFDPFMGAGTTALVALKLGRHYYGSEINPEYVRLAEERLAGAQLRLF